METPVGDRYVLEALDAGGCSLGGEQSGHVIFRDLATTGDGLLTGLCCSTTCAAPGRPLAELAAAAMTRLPQVLVNVRVEAGRPTAVAERIAARGGRRASGASATRAGCSCGPAAPSRWCG